MLKYVPNMETVIGIRQGIKDHFVVMCKIELLDTWIEREEKVNGT